MWGFESRDVLSCKPCRVLPVSQKYLLMKVTLRSSKHMKQLVSRKFKPFEPIGFYIEELHIFSCIEHHDRPFHHLVPYYTANRLSRLRKLVLTGFEGHDTVFPVSPQLRSHLSRFQLVTCLHLVDFHFQAFWDLRRFVVALPRLSFLHLSRVTWPQFSEGIVIVPSLLSIAHNFQKISCRGTIAMHEVLWFWVTTHKLPSLEYQMTTGHSAQDRYSSLKIKDIAAIRKWMGQLELSGYGSPNFKWEYSEEKRCCKLHLSPLTV